jgi:hypothetical protein
MKSRLFAGWLRVVVGFLVLAFCAAPVPGDVGGCNQRAEALDAEAFFTQKAEIDCARCGECALSGLLCDSACSSLPAPPDFAEGCAPTVHDGEVCLHALAAASCEDYRAFMRDESPTAPTECNFCPRRPE